MPPPDAGGKPLTVSLQLAAKENKKARASRDKADQSVATEVVEPPEKDTDGRVPGTALPAGQANESVWF